MYKFTQTDRFIVMLSRKAKHPALAKENPYFLRPDSSLHFVSLRMTRRYMSLQINTPEAYKRLINNNVSKSVSLRNLDKSLSVR